jgi:TonB family protein
MSSIVIQILRPLADASVRALCLALIALLLLAIFRPKSAAARHAVWTVVLVAMLALPVFAPLLPPLPVKINSQSSMPVNPGLAGGAIVAPSRAPGIAGAKPLPPFSAPRWPIQLAGVYLAVMSVLLARVLFAYRATRRLVRGSEFVRDVRASSLFETLAASHSIARPLPQLRASNSVIVPITIGWSRPAILLPASWQSWDDWKLRAVLTHELAHIRRGDWLVTLAASVNRCLFWFHPLAWWLERRLSALAELASDDAVLGSLGDAPRYAAAVLEFAAALQARGGRFARYGVAMARTPNVSHRITRILELRHPGPGIMKRSSWLAILACALPLVYSAAALQISRTLPEPGTHAGIAQLLTEGSRLSAAEVQQLEQQLARDPEDLAARGKLVAYYSTNNISHPRLEHILWLIEHHPESAITLYFSRERAFNSTDDDRVKALWMKQTTEHRNDAQVLSNAAKYLGRTGQFAEQLAEEDLLKRARQLEPSNPEYTKALADLFVSAIARSLMPSAEAAPGPPTEPSLASAAKEELEASTDAALVGTVGEYLSRLMGGTMGPAGETRAEYAELLLKRAQSLDPTNPEWSEAIDRLNAARQNPPAQTPPNGDRRIRVGNEVQESNLLQRVDPVYPPLALQARVQGIVRFSVTIGRDGHVRNIELIAGHPLLVPAALNAVKQWLYRPTLLNGDPVDVAAVVDVPFRLP